MAFRRAGTRQTTEQSVRSLTPEIAGVSAETPHWIDPLGELLLKLLEHVPVMVTIMDAQVNLMYVNKEFVRVLGWTEEDVRRMPDLTTVCHPDPEQRAEAIEFARRAERKWGEFNPISKSGVPVPSSWMNIRIGETLVGIGVDITERKLREWEAERAREEVEARVERHLTPANRYSLSFRELSVLTLVAEGKTDREIAELLSIGYRTVQTHIGSILTKMGAKVRTEAGVRAVREGIID